jgi:ribonuclease T1
MLKYRHAIAFTLALFLITCVCPAAWSQTPSCEDAVSTLNTRISSGIDKQELVETLRVLDQSKSRKLPQKFVPKSQARSRGWKPGSDLWSINSLKGSSIGGDEFGNLERRLPKGRWREADLDYKGGHRGGKRLVFSWDGRRFVTIDHYRTFTEISPCH